MLLLRNINVLILEDSSDDARDIKEGLLKLQNGSIDKFDKDHIHKYLVEEAEISQIYDVFIQKIKEYDIDILFIDLNLIANYEDGMKIIETLVNEDGEIKNVLKYIVSSQNVKNTEMYKKIEQYTNLFIQKPSSGIETYETCFINANLVDTLPLLVNMYREVKKSFSIDSILKNIEYKIDKIEINTVTIIQRTKLIENMNQTMIKFLPTTLADDKQKKELKEFIQNDMSQYLEFDEDNFFPEEEDRKKFLEAVSKQFDEIVTSGVKGETWNLLKAGIKDIAITQGLDNDNAGLCAVKLVYRGYSEVARIVRGEA